MRPGHDTRLETAASIADVQATDQGAREDGARRRVHHGDGRLEPGAVRREAPADAGRARRRGARPSRASSSRRSPARPRPTRAARRSSPARASRSATPARSPPTRRRSPRSTRCARCRRSTIRSAARWTRMAYSASVGVTTNVDMGAFISAGPARHAGVVRRRHAGERRPVPDVRRVRRAASRGQDDRRGCGCSSCRWTRGPTCRC